MLQNMVYETKEWLIDSDSLIQFKSSNKPIVNEYVNLKLDIFSRSKEKLKAKTQFPDKARCKQLSLLPLPQGQVKRALNQLARFILRKSLHATHGKGKWVNFKKKFQIKITSTEASNSFTSLR